MGGPNGGVHNEGVLGGGIDRSVDERDNWGKHPDGPVRHGIGRTTKKGGGTAEDKAIRGRVASATIRHNPGGGAQLEE